MKNYRNSDYAVNKFSEGIVYRFGNETVEITLQDYLQDNPDKTEADFKKLKAISDQIYYDQDRAENAQTKKNICRNHRIHKETVCSNDKYFPESELLDIVWQHIKTEVMIFSDLESRLQKVVHSSPYQQQLAVIETEIRSTELRLKKLNSLLLSLFATYSAGDIPAQEYMSIRQRYESEIEVKNKHLSELHCRKAEAQNQANIQNEWTVEIAKYRTAECLTKEMASALIERIELYPDKKVNIILKYQDAYSATVTQIDNMEASYCE